jgi:hypothetical protein
MQHAQPTRGDKVRETFKHKRARGEVTGRVPLGYKVVYDERGYNPTVVVDPEVMPLVEEARRLRAEGMSIRKICRITAASGLRSRHGRIIGPSSMVKILHTRQSL